MTFSIRSLITAAGCMLSLSGLSALAQTPAPTPAITNTTYAVYIHGLHAVDATVAYQIQPWGYGASATLHSVGLASLFIRMHLQASAEGRFTPEGAADPIVYESDGLSRGENRHVRIVYKGDTPADITVSPPEPDREPVPRASLTHTLDTLSGLATLIHALTATGRCDGSGDVFDGLRLTHMTFHGPTPDTIPDDSGSFYTGAGLRCDFVGQQRAGFIKDTPNRAKMSQPEPGAAWFSRIDGFGLVPVRVEMEHPKLGHVIIVMQQAVRH